MLKAPLFAAACAAEPNLALPTAGPSEGNLLGVTATPEPPTPTPIPPTPVPPTPAPPTVQIQPAQILQGGTALVVVNEPATSGTVTFQGRQYPLLRSGSRSWAVVGTGAFATPQAYALQVSYTPEGRPPANLTASLTVADEVYPTENIVLDPNTSALLDPAIVNAELARRASIYSAYTMRRLWSGAFVRPHTGPVSSPYGVSRSYNGGPVTSYHTGTDFAGDAGTPVLAAAAGRAAFTGELMVRGNSVILDHGAGVFTAYHHLSRIDVTEGQSVAAGQQVGALGATGLVTAAHLHWEIVVRGIEIDGQLWLTGQEWGL
jgi:murein DD-endopeptidase MepM/ murein hydrolase activator NlpD